MDYFFEREERAEAGVINTIAYRLIRNRQKKTFTEARTVANLFVARFAIVGFAKKSFKFNGKLISDDAFQCIKSIYL